MARRVNKRFLITLTLVIMGGLLALVVMQKVLTLGNASKYWDEGDSHFRAQRFKEAKESYVRALRLDRKNVEGLVKLGDASHELTRSERDEIGKDVRIWESALEINPAYAPVLEKLLDAYLDMSELRGLPEDFNKLGEKARAMLRADNGNTRARILEQIGVVGGWLAGATTSSKEVEERLAQLGEAAKQKPHDWRIPWYLARANLRLAQEREARNDPDGAKPLRDRALQTFEEATVAEPQNAALAYRHYLVVAALLEPKPGAEMNPQDRQRLRVLLDRARELAEKELAEKKKDDRDYVDIELAWVGILLQEGKAEDAEKKLQELLKERSSDQRIRQRLSSLWRSMPGKRDAAIALLEEQVPDDPSLVGFRAYLKTQLEFSRWTNLAVLRLDAYNDADEKTRRALDENGRRELKERIVSDYKKAAGIYSEEEQPMLLKLKGKILLMEGDPKSSFEALKLWQRAYDKLEQRGTVDAELTYELARLYNWAGETGQYGKLLSRLVERYPALAQPRKALAYLQIRQQQFAEADRNLKALESGADARNDPDLVRLRMSLLLAQGHTREVQDLLKSMPEDTPAQKLYKAGAASAVDETTLAVSLLVPLSDLEIEAATDKYPAMQSLARLYYRNGKKEEAGRLVERALLKNPKNAALKLLQLWATDHATPEQVWKIEGDVAEGIADPVVRALEYYRILRAQEKSADAYASLLEADKATHGDGRIVEALFNHAMEIGKWDAAAQYADRLGRLDWDQAGGVYYQARLKLAQKDPEGAVAAAMELTRKSTGFSRSWTIMGEAQQLSGQYEPALASYSKALDMQLDNFEALRGKIACHIALRQYGLARQFIDRGVKTSGHRDYFLEVGRRLEEQQGDALSVTPDREQAVRDHPESVVDWLALCNNYARVSDNLLKKDPQNADKYLAKSMAKLREAIQKWPDDRDVHWRLAELLQNSSKPEEAQKVLESLAGREKWKDRPTPYLMLAAFYQRMGPDYTARAEQAYLDAVSRASEKTPDAQKQDIGKQDVQKELVTFYVQSNQTDKAIKLLTQLIDATKNPSLRQRLIEIEVAVGKRDEAEKLLKEALTAHPADVRLLTLMGFVKMMQGDYPAATSHFGQALKANPQYAPALFYRGNMRMNQGDMTGAMADLLAARDLNPNNVDYRVSLSDAYKRRGQLEDSSKEMEIAVQLAPFKRELREKLIQFYVADMRWAPVERLLDDAKALPELARDATWWKLESQMWVQRGDTQKAMQAAQVAMKMAPEDSEVVYAFLEVLLKEKQYNQIITMTDAILAKPTAERPWWLYVMRGAAWQGLGKSDRATGSPEKSGEYDLALTAVDKTADEAAAEGAADLLVKLLLRPLGPDKTVAKLKDRVNARWAIQLVQVYLSNEQWQKAIDLMDRLLEKDSFDALNDTQKVKLLRTASQGYTAASVAIPEAFAKAKATSERYIREMERRHVPVDVQLEALNNLACLVAEHPKSKDPKGAIPFIQKAYNVMQQSQFNGGIADTYGWILVLSGKLDEGIEVLRDVVSKDRPPADAYYHLGEGYILKSLPDEALAALTRAAELSKEYQQKGMYVDASLDSKIQNATARAKQLPKAAAAKSN